MAGEYIFDQIEKWNEKFSDFFQHRKKVSALKNFSEADYFPHKHYLSLIKQCMKDGFLDHKESEFLDHMLKKYEMNYLDWAYKTKWVMQKILEGSKKRSCPKDQLFFDMERLKVPVHIPVGSLIQTPKTTRVAI